MISHIEANDLLDLYGELLSARQQEILSLYFQEDLSLSEIQENLSITRSAAYDALKKGISAMKYFEEKLHLLQINRHLQDMILRHPELADEIEIIFEQEKAG